MTSQRPPANSAPPHPRQTPTGWRPVFYAAAMTAVTLAALGLAVLAVQGGGSPDYSAASGMGSGMPSGGGSPETPTPGTAGTTGSTPTPSPRPDYEATIAANTARPAPKPFEAPTAAPTPFPTCPADGSGVDCYFVPPEPTPTAVPFPTPLLACDSLRTAVAMGSEVGPSWCSEDPATPLAPTGASDGTTDDD